MADIERDVIAAWHIAAYGGMAFAGKLPKLETVLNRIRHSGRKTVEGQRAQAAMLAEHLGKSFRPLSQEATRALMALRAKRGE